MTKDEMNELVRLFDKFIDNAMIDDQTKQGFLAVRSLLAMLSSQFIGDN